MAISYGAKVLALGGDSPRLIATSEKSRFTTMRQARRNQTNADGKQRQKQNPGHCNADVENHVNSKFIKKALPAWPTGL
jgi:hypothetical protein